MKAIEKKEEFTDDGELKLIGSVSNDPLMAVSREEGRVSRGFSLIARWGERLKRDLYSLATVGRVRRPSTLLNSILFIFLVLAVLAGVTWWIFDL